MKHATLFALILISLDVNADCVVGSYKIVGSALRTCESSIVATKGTYSGTPRTLDVLELLQKSKSPTLEADFKSLTDMSVADGKKYLQEELNGKNFNTSFSADSAELIPALERLGNEMNKVLKLDDAVAQLASNEKADAQRLPLKDPIQEMDAMGEKNRRALSQVRSACAGNPQASADLRAVEILFADGARTYAVPTGVSYADRGNKEGTLNFVDDSGSQVRKVASRNGKLYYKGKDDREYEVTSVTNVTASKIGYLRSMGDRRSTACYVNDMSRKGDQPRAASGGTVDATN